MYAKSQNLYKSDDLQVTPEPKVAVKRRELYNKSLNIFLKSITALLPL